MTDETYKNRLRKNIEKSLECKEKAEVEIRDLKVSLGSLKGDNFLSEIYRAEVDYEVNGIAKTTSIIAKCMLEKGESSKVAEEFEVYEKEREMYAKILPKMSELTKVKISPECYHVATDDAAFFMEDLTNSGFQTADRIIGLDLNHSKIVVEKLAKFHAASMVLLAKDHNVFVKFKEGLFKRKYSSNFMKEFLDSSILHLLDVVREWEGFENIVRKIESIVGHMDDRILKCVTQPTAVKVLNHGDCWTNNVMFKYDDATSTPKDAVFVKTFLFNLF